MSISSSSSSNSSPDKWAAGCDKTFLRTGLCPVNRDPFQPQATIAFANIKKNLPEFSSLSTQSSIWYLMNRFLSGDWINLGHCNDANVFLNRTTMSNPRTSCDVHLTSTQPKRFKIFSKRSLSLMKLRQKCENRNLVKVSWLSHWTNTQSYLKWTALVFTINV